MSHANYRIPAHSSISNLPRTAMVVDKLIAIGDAVIGHIGLVQKPILKQPLLSHFKVIKGCPLAGSITASSRERAGLVNTVVLSYRRNHFKFDIEVKFSNQYSVLGCGYKAELK